MNARQPGPPDEVLIAFMAAYFAFIFGILCFSFLLWLAIEFFFARTVARCLDKVRPDNRELDPGQAYYIMIPLFNLYWAFRLHIAVSDSLENEYHGRRWRSSGDFGREVGKWWAICRVASLVAGALAGLPGLVLFVLYWVKVAELSRELDSDDGPDPGYGRRRSRRRYEDEDDDYEDDRR